MPVFQRKLSETMHKEWAREQFPNELRHILDGTLSASPSRLTALEELAEKGSNLAQVMIGEIYLNGRCGAGVDENLARRNFEYAYYEGSVEAGYRLARYLQFRQRHLEAREIFDNLANINYSPALWQIAYGYFRGYWDEKDDSKAIFFFKKASEFGHLRGKYWNYWLSLRTSRSLREVSLNFSSLLITRVQIATFSLLYPNSDRLRIW